MVFITFIYRIGDNDKTYFGKYNPTYLSDEEVKSWLVDGLNSYRKQEKLPTIIEPIHVGVLSLSEHAYIPTYSSDHEKKCFDFYFEIKKGYYEIHVNGKLVHNDVAHTV